MGVVAYVCNLSIQKEKLKGAEVQGQPGLVKKKKRKKGGREKGRKREIRSKGGRKEGVRFKVNPQNGSAGDTVLKRHRPKLKDHY